MKTQLNLEDLEVFNLAHKIGHQIWNIVIKWKYFEKDTIGKQVCRSADSISANIAEGFGRFSFKENKHFCYYARGSLYETKNWMQKSIERNLIVKSDFESINDNIEILQKKLNAYIKSIGNFTK